MSHFNRSLAPENLVVKSNMSRQGGKVGNQF